jgi:hypothetical protein
MYARTRKWYLETSASTVERGEQDARARGPASIAAGGASDDLPLQRISATDGVPADCVVLRSFQIDSFRVERGSKYVGKRNRRSRPARLST